jgi:hypothetical protein
VAVASPNAAMTASIISAVLKFIVMGEFGAVYKVLRKAE